MMSITNQMVGALRFLGLKFSVKNLPIKMELLKIDQFVREHPFFQYANSELVLIFPPIESLEEFQKSDFLCGRYVIGAPSTSAMDTSFIIRDTDPCNAITAEFVLNYELSGPELFELFLQVRENLIKSESIGYWKLRMNPENGNAVLQIVLNEEKLFFDFIDNC